MATEQRYCEDCEKETLHRYGGQRHDGSHIWRCQPCRVEFELEVFA